MFCMMTSSNGFFFALLAICARNSPAIGEFPAQRPMTRSFDVFIDLRLNKRRGWWFETPWHPLWRHCDGQVPRQKCCRHLFKYPSDRITLRTNLRDWRDLMLWRLVSSKWNPRALKENMCNNLRTILVKYFVYEFTVLGVKLWVYQCMGWLSHLYKN